ncbi:MAG TPA: Trm112 family protein [Acidobacteriota bacterium]|nr:Trm112 family protein [Acidobacteriota bacterium]
MVLSRKLLDKLACPKCHGPLEYDRANDSLTCTACKLRYRVTDDIPVLLLQEAEKINE